MNPLIRTIPLRDDANTGGVCSHAFECSRDMHCFHCQYEHLASVMVDALVIANLYLL
jgi:hypothetical protein